MVSEISHKTTTRFDRFNDRVLLISKILTVISVIVLLGMTIIIVVDVIGRYFFAYPLPGANELAGILLIMVATWGMAYCQLLKRNIRIDIICSRFNPKGQSVMDIISYLVFIFAFSIISWRMLIKMFAYLNDPSEVTEILGLPFWPFMLVAAIGFGWSTFVFIVELIYLVKEIIKR
jgi:TRAP-type C4-dicarboxylate transport system permease small subunit